MPNVDAAIAAIDAPLMMVRWRARRNGERPPVEEICAGHLRIHA
jgi:hypothetical protein